MNIDFARCFKLFSRFLISSLFCLVKYFIEEDHSNSGTFENTAVGYQSDFRLQERLASSLVELHRACRLVGVASVLPLSGPGDVKNSGCPFLDDFLDTQRMDVMSAAACRITLERRIGYIYLHPNVQAWQRAILQSSPRSALGCRHPLANRFIIRQEPPTVR